MRGVVVAGAALALEQLGMQDHFSAYYGASAGTLTAAYLASRQATWGTSVFYDDLLHPDFFSWRRVLRGGAPMNLDFLFDRVVRGSKKLDVERALEKKIHIYASRASSGDLVGWSDWSSGEDLLGAARASMTLPLVAGGPYRYRGEEFFDAGVHTSVPWREALGDGCRYLLVLLSRPKSSPREHLSGIEKFLGSACKPVCRKTLYLSLRK